MLNVKQIRTALSRLGALAYRDHIDLEVFLVGGSAIALAYGTRDSTQDVDAVIVRPEDKRKLYGPHSAGCGRAGARRKMAK